MSLNIDRMALADCFTTDQILDCLFRQLPDLCLPIPLEDIAYALGIERIAYKSGVSFEGALIRDPNNDYRGNIAIRAETIRSRQRFSLGHELGHFLLPGHYSEASLTTCNNIGLNNGRGSDRREREADFFAANLLMPKHLFLRDIKTIGEPDLLLLKALFEIYEVSAEAFLRRYVDFSEFQCCLIFSKDGNVRYPYWSERIPYLNVRKNQAIPPQSCTVNFNEGDGSVSDVEEVESWRWLSEGRQMLPSSLNEQTLCQADGYKVTLIWHDELLDEDEEDEVEWEPPRFKK